MTVRRLLDETRGSFHTAPCVPRQVRTQEHDDGLSRRYSPSVSLESFSSTLLREIWKHSGHSPNATFFDRSRTSNVACRPSWYSQYIYRDEIEFRRVSSLGL